MTRIALASRMAATAVAAALLLTAACGGSGSDVPPAAEDEAAARRIVLTSADLPGYTEDVGEEEDQSSTAVDECLNDNPLFADNYPRASESPDFAKGDGAVRVQSGVTFAEKVGDARKGFSDVRAALAGPCLKDEVRKSLQEAVDPGVVVQGVTVSSLPAPRGFDEAVASRLSIPVQVGSSRLSFYAELTYLRQGRGIAAVETFQIDEPFPEAERNRLAAVVGGRLKAHEDGAG